MADKKDPINDYFTYKDMVSQIYKNKTDDIYENALVACFGLQQLLYESYKIKLEELEEFRKQYPEHWKLFKSTEKERVKQ